MQREARDGARGYEFAPFVFQPLVKRLLVENKTEKHIHFLRVLQGREGQRMV